MATILLRIYRFIRYSEEENRVFFEVRERHLKIHKRNLLAGGFPVFVAATISAAAVAIIKALTDSQDLEIFLSFLYAFAIAQMIGYLVIFNVPTSSVRFPLFHYSLFIVQS